MEKVMIQIIAFKLIINICNNRKNKRIRVVICQKDFNEGCVMNI